MTGKNYRVKPRIPSGFFELLPGEQLIFNQMIEKIRQTYELFGFVPVETPAIEFSEILLAKSGKETEKQIYHINKLGDDLALHFDLTVPIARYTAEHYRELAFPFRRYQIQKVWRGERKQRGRFREFYQCDIDVIGSTNVMTDAEMPGVIFHVFKNLGIDNFIIKISNRKILSGFLEHLGLTEQSMNVLHIIDKLENNNAIKFYEGMKQLKIPRDKIEAIYEFLNIKGSDEEIFYKLNSIGVKSDTFWLGVNELIAVIKALRLLKIPDKFFGVDLSIVRGLDYYTGTVYETFVNNYPEIGSICSGGRYDDLSRYYSDKSFPGVGLSIGLTRLFFTLKELGVIKFGRLTPSLALIIPVSEEGVRKSFELATLLRNNGINTELYFDSKNINKPMKYADKLKIPFVILIGKEEVKRNKISLKNMTEGKQYYISVDEAIKVIAKTKEKNE